MPELQSVHEKSSGNSIRNEDIEKTVVVAPVEGLDADSQVRPQTPAQSNGDVKLVLMDLDNGLVGWESADDPENPQCVLHPIDLLLSLMMYKKLDFGPEMVPYVLVHHNDNLLADGIIDMRTRCCAHVGRIRLVFEDNRNIDGLHLHSRLCSGASVPITTLRAIRASLDYKYVLHLPLCVSDRMCIRSGYAYLNRHAASCWSSWLCCYGHCFCPDCRCLSSP